MIKVGLTGSIGMGKSTTAGMFRQEGIRVYDADATVHELYSGEAVPVVEKEFPGVSENGVINRQKLGAKVLGDPGALKKLEMLIHPLVHRKEQEFCRLAEESGEKFVILDIPLLFEAGGDKRVDKIIVVTAPYEVQRERVLSRPDMTDEKFEAILEKQMPDREKRKRADFLIDSSKGLESAYEQVRNIIRQLGQNSV